MSLLLLFVSILCPFCCLSAESGTLHVFAPGDIIIGGLFPIHLEANRTMLNGDASCTKYDLQMFLRAQVMIFAIQEINQRTPRVLPDLTLGYDIYDTCGDVTFAIRATLELLKGQSDPRAKVVIGERYSELSIVVARIFALSSLTQISYGSTSELLSRKLKFPTFLRTVSSDIKQTMAIAKMVEKLKWEVVAVVGSDDEYGKYGSEKLIVTLKTMKVCIDFKEILPGYFSRNESKTRTKLAKLVRSIKDSSAEAIILFTKDSNIHIIMEAAIQQNLNRTWIASDSWSTSSKIMEIPGIQKVGQVFGFIFKGNEVPGWRDYVISLFNGTTNPLLQHHWNQYPPCSNLSEEKDCSLNNSQDGSKQCLDPSCLVNYIDQDESYSIYLAVKVITEGLRSLLKCDSRKCERNADFTAFELLQEIKKVNFSVNTTHISFDANGDPSIGYDILQWNMSESKDRVKTIGEYWPSGNITLPDDLTWKMGNVTVTVFNCSKTCEPGYELKIQRKHCCKQCIQCGERDYSSGAGVECKPCKNNEYSSPLRDKCLEKTVEFLHWSDPFVIVLTSFEILGIVMTIMVAILFAIHRSTPIVKAVGGYLSFLELLSLLACFCVTFTFILKPTDVSCKVGLPVFGMAFTLCISCILANLLQICVGFSFDLNMGAWLKKLNQPVAVVAVIFGIQLAVCVPWLIHCPPFPHREPLNKTILLQCKTGSKALFGAMLGYNSLLAFACFVFAFKGKRLPDLYKNASFITIGMLLFLVVWILFIPIYINNLGKYARAIEAAAIIVSSYSILCCHLAPKCYIMVFRKEINNEHAIAEHIRKHYEQKGMPVMKS
ncbi:G-protein coupled receptor family C group 6 member A-like [Centroberyx affinis]|uniref:G-protein coupled receptor family C group 6 member A-like n=1 Tax=Centroberyx affinis TaxID=166261 RepID=UPI003A5C474D